MTVYTAWTGSLADVYSHRYGRIAQDFFRTVVEPSLEALHRQRGEWSMSPDPAAVFGLVDLMELINKTNMAFCLSIQSLWEQQIRSYLKDCVRYLELDVPMGEIEHAKWGDSLNSMFYRIRGIHLPSFDSYATFDLLQLLANACRHGDGNSSRKLWGAHPELWPSKESYSWLHPASASPPLIQHVQISRELLEEFVTAIVWFWDDIRYEYTGSLESNNPHVEADLVRMRAEKAIRVRRTPL